jgi:hypothetical protein
MARLNIALSTCGCAGSSFGASSLPEGTASPSCTKTAGIRIGKLLLGGYPVRRSSIYAPQLLPEGLSSAGDQGGIARASFCTANVSVKGCRKLHAGEAVEQQWVQRTVGSERMIFGFKRTGEVLDCIFSAVIRRLLPEAPETADLGDDGCNESFARPFVVFYCPVEHGCDALLFSSRTLL